MRLATVRDMDSIMHIVRESVVLMQQEHNPQWNDSYPAEQHFWADIDNGHLYVAEREEEVRGVICLNTNEPGTYGTLHWSRPGPALVIHRMAIAPWSRKQGVGTGLLQFAEQLAKEQKLDYLKTDTYSHNAKMNRLLLACGYKKTGEVNLDDRPYKFNCYEKCL